MDRGWGRDEGEMPRAATALLAAAYRPRPSSSRRSSSDLSTPDSLASLSTVQPRSRRRSLIARARAPGVLIERSTIFGTATSKPSSRSLSEAGMRGTSQGRAVSPWIEDTIQSEMRPGIAGPATRWRPLRALRRRADRSRRPPRRSPPPGRRSRWSPPTPPRAPPRRNRT